jgi:glutamate N-acetyltransferase/amino-acid N-acetyltransferase
MTAEVARGLDCAAEDVLVCSTGVIGRFLPREKLAAGIPGATSRLTASAEAFRDAATAMMTTDTFPKLATRSHRVGAAELRVSGVAKGAAMIAPNMATMLAILMTDAALSPKQADAILRHAVNRSFNSISVDGHMSTSDTALLLAANPGSTQALAERDLAAVQGMVDEVAVELAQAIIRDAEGADHFITLEVRGAKTRDDAMRIARAIADSALVKTAIAGGDPNWGRIVSAAGYAGVPFREEDLTLKVNGVLLYRSGVPTRFDAKKLSQDLKSNRDVLIELELTLGNESLRFWTSDLTAEYVRLNADNTT